MALSPPEALARTSTYIDVHLFGNIQLTQILRTDVVTANEGTTLDVRWTNTARPAWCRVSVDGVVQDMHAGDGSSYFASWYPARPVQKLQLPFGATVTTEVVLAHRIRATIALTATAMHWLGGGAATSQVNALGEPTVQVIVQMAYKEHRGAVHTRWRQTTQDGVHVYTRRVWFRPTKHVPTPNGLEAVRLFELVRSATAWSPEEVSLHVPASLRKFVVAPLVQSS